MQANEFRLLVSIVNYCSADLVCAQLPLLCQQLNTQTDRVVVVDNCSPDNSVAVLRAFIEKNNLTNFVYFIASDTNGGFSAGNNVAITSGLEIVKNQPEFVLLLNPDTALKENALSTLIDFLQSHGAAGIAGSRLEGERGEPQHSAFRFHTITSEFITGINTGFIRNLLSKWAINAQQISDKAIQVDWIAGASMLIKYQVIEDIGLMDEQYFLYFEETDFCLQAARKGWQCWYVPDSVVTHYVGQSTGVISGDKKKRRRPKYWFEARQYYFRKNHGIIYAACADFVRGTTLMFSKIRRSVIGKPSNEPECMIRDFWRNSIFLSWLDRK